MDVSRGEGDKLAWGDVRDGECKGLPSWVPKRNFLSWAPIMGTGQLEESNHEPTATSCRQLLPGLPALFLITSMLTWMFGH